jgi:hypothetical protein
MLLIKRVTDNKQTKENITSRKKHENLNCAAATATVSLT